MCGIAGRVFTTPVEDERARALTERFACAQRTRGPDGVGTHHDGEVVLVHRRLAILDLSEAGNQPLWNEDGTVCVVVNGEIYNFAALRERLIARGHRFRSRSDSEVLVHLYEDGGIAGCCAAAEGMFAFALWDARTRDLWLVRDRLGIKPLVVAEHDGGVTFGSTLHGVLADPDVPRALREEALLAAFEWGFVPAPWSAIAAARRVMPGTWLRVRQGRVVEERRWWTDAPVRDEVADQDVREAVTDAVRSHLVADVPVGTLLSAGIDSGLVTALATRHAGAGALHVWTASQRGCAEDEFAEAQRAARHFGVGIEEIPIGAAGLSETRFDEMIAAMDEPLIDASLISLHRLFAAIARDRRVVLSGDGGDELFAGYDWHVPIPPAPWWGRTTIFRGAAPGLRRLHGRRGRMGTIGTVARYVSRHPADLYLDRIRIGSPEALERLGLDGSRASPIVEAARQAWERFDGAGTLNQMLAVDRATLLPDQMLAKVDSASMAHAVEARVPLLADRVLEVSKALPEQRKRLGGTGKIALRAWFEEIGPPGAAGRRKSGFNSPLDAWVGGPGGEWLRDRARSTLEQLTGRGELAGLSPRLIFAAAVLDGWVARAEKREPLAVAS